MSKRRSRRKRRRPALRILDCGTALSFLPKGRPPITLGKQHPNWQQRAIELRKQLSRQP